MTDGYRPLADRFGRPRAAVARAVPRDGRSSPGARWRPKRGRAQPATPGPAGVRRSGVESGGRLVRPEDSNREGGAVRRAVGSSDTPPSGRPVAAVGTHFVEPYTIYRSRQRSAAVSAALPERRRTGTPTSSPPAVRVRVSRRLGRSRPHSDGSDASRRDDEFLHPRGRRRKPYVAIVNAPRRSRDYGGLSRAVMCGLGCFTPTELTIHANVGRFRQRCHSDATLTRVRPPPLRFPFPSPTASARYWPCHDCRVLVPLRQLNLSQQVCSSPNRVREAREREVEAPPAPSKPLHAYSSPPAPPIRLDLNPGTSRRPSSYRSSPTAGASGSSSSLAATLGGPMETISAPTSDGGRVPEPITKTATDGTRPSVSGLKT